MPSEGDIFAYDVIVIPVCYGEHWSALVVTDYRKVIEGEGKGDIKLWDSGKKMKIHRGGEAWKVVRGWLNANWKLGAPQGRILQEVVTEEVAQEALPTLLSADSTSAREDEPPTPEFDCASPVIPPKAKRARKDKRFVPFTTKSVPGSTPQCPQQVNEYDCGVFAVAFIKAAIAGEECNQVDVGQLREEMALAAWSVKQENMAEEGCMGL